MQYAFDVEDDDEFMIQLMQKSTRDKDGSVNKTIGFTVLKVSAMGPAWIQMLNVQTPSPSVEEKKRKQQQKMVSSLPLSPKQKLNLHDQNFHLRNQRWVGGGRGEECFSPWDPESMG